MNHRLSHFLRCGLTAWLTAALLVAAGGLARGQDDAQPAMPGVENGPVAGAVQSAPPEFAPGEILVGVHTGQAQSASILAAVQAQMIDSFDAGDPDDGVMTLLLGVPPDSEAEAIALLRDDPAVIYAEPNWTVYAADEPLPAPSIDAASASVEQPFAVNDPFYADQQWYLQRISMSRAWQLSQSSAGFGGQLASVVVSVIDSGVDPAHPEFAGRMLPGVNYITPGAAVVDDCGHGTHVAGLAAAGLNNGKGIAGPAPAYIEARKVLQASGSGCTGTVANVAKAIREAADANVDVINLSLTLFSNSDTLRLAVEYAGARGMLMIAAAGNAGASIVYYPARYPQVMAVAALDQSDGHAVYSNTGNEIEIAAPGGSSARSVFSTWSSAAISRCTDGYQSSGGASYCNSTGTSMAAGIVSGVAALVRATAPSLSASETRSVLRDTASALPLATTKVGSGKVSPSAALRRLLTSNLTLSQTSFHQVAPYGSTPYTLTVRMDNPSLDNIDWKATLPASNWVTLNASVSGSLNGSLRFGEPDFLTLTVSPTHLITGAYSSALVITGTRTNGGKIVQQVGIFQTVGPEDNWVYIPLVYSATGVAPTPTPLPFRWEAPLVSSDRTSYGLTDDSSLPVSFPSTFTFSFGGQSFSELRLHSDGYVTFASTVLTNTLPAACLPRTTEPNQAIFGWWANLNPGAPGATVSTFPVGVDRFVVEFANTPAVSSTQPYTLSFQIVLYRSGAIGLNYDHAPEFVGAPANVTVGAVSNKGLFYNLAACATASRTLGVLPTQQQSLIIQPGGLF